MTVTRTARALQNAAAGGWQGAPIGASRASIGRAGSSLHRANEPRPVYGFMGLGRGSRYDHHIWSTLGSPSRRTRRVRRALRAGARERSEEHTSELQSLMRISYAVFCLKKKNN